MSSNNIHKNLFKLSSPSSLPTHPHLGIQKRPPPPPFFSHQTFPWTPRPSQGSPPPRCQWTFGLNGFLRNAAVMEPMVTSQRSQNEQNLELVSEVGVFFLPNFFSSKRMLEGSCYVYYDTSKSSDVEVVFFLHVPKKCGFAMMMVVSRLRSWCRFFFWNCSPLCGVIWNSGNGPKKKRLQLVAVQRIY